MRSLLNFEAIFVLAAIIVGTPICAENVTGLVPGTKFSPPVDDPATDGWNTEKLSAAADERIRNITAYFNGSVDAPLRKLAEITAKDIVFGLLKPKELETVFGDSSFVIRRAALSQNEDIKSGITTFERELLSLINFAENPTKVRTKVKVFRVHAKDGLFKTSAYIQSWGECDDGTFQMNVTWHCDWFIKEGAMILGKIITSDYLEAIGIKTESGEQMFSDCTEAVLGNTPDFYAQLAPSMDQWLHHIAIQHHLNIAGWEGISISDVNGDGRDDFYLPQPGGLPNRLFIQKLDGTCVDYSRDSGTDWLNQSHGAVFADLDNDGDQDLVIGVHDGLIVMSNNGKGNFITRSGLILPAAVPYSITVADYDNDGDLDIFAACYNRRSGVNRNRVFAKAIPYHDANNGGRNVLLRSDATPETGNWEFRYVTGGVGLDVNNRRFSYASAWEDYDNDGDLDLYVANDFGRNNLYRNNSGKFEDVAASAGVEDISAGMSVSWADYNNDGWMDLYISNMFSSAGNRIAFQREFQTNADETTKGLFQRHARGNTLFENAKDGTFKDVSIEAGVTLGRWAWGSRFLDLNNDGWQDILVANGFLTQSDTEDL